VCENWKRSIRPASDHVRTHGRPTPDPTRLGYRGGRTQVPWCRKPVTRCYYGLTEPGAVPMSVGSRSTAPVKATIVFEMARRCGSLWTTLPGNSCSICIGPDEEKRRRRDSPAGMSCFHSRTHNERFLVRHTTEARHSCSNTGTLAAGRAHPERESRCRRRRGFKIAMFALGRADTQVRLVRRA